MSEGLYSMEAKDYDKTLDLTKIKPYGDTMNDGKVQLSFTLPVPAGAEAEEAAKQLLKKMGFENPLVVYQKELTEGFCFMNCYGSLTHTVDYTTIHVPKVESTTMDMHACDDYIRENIGRKLVCVGASTGTDAHTVGIDAIMNMNIQPRLAGAQRRVHRPRHRAQGRRPARQPDRYPEGCPHQEYDRAGRDA